MLSLGKNMAKKNELYLLLGSNLGDRLALMAEATALIIERVGAVIKSSQIYQTAPWGVLEQPAFLNQVLKVETTLHPIDVLSVILKIEKQLGRERKEVWGARLIDIDILYYANVLVTMSDLVIPHQQLHNRRFTLVPLAEVAPDYVHPKLKKTNQALLDCCEDDGIVFVLS
jgi:2-amino-4-hydroxy-6-hydroxymethyldihydropteridine diphosphokinase